MKLIDKDALVAEIEKLKEIYCYDTKTNSSFVAKAVINSINNAINTLEVKGVDLDEEIGKYISDNFFGSETMGFFAARTKEEPNYIDMALCAKHFFELGLKASNPLTVKDIENIYHLVNKVSDDLGIRAMYVNIYQETLKRFKAQKGE